MSPKWFGEKNLGALRIAAIYLLIGGLWILFSDRLAGIIAADQNSLVIISIIKGWVYIVVTAMLLFWLIRRHTTELGEREKQYQSLVEEASDGIFIADRDGKFIDVNIRGCSMLGFTREEMLGKRITDLIPTNDLVSVPSRFEELRAGANLITERGLIHKDGSVLPVEISAKILADGSLQWIVRDITERKQAEEKIRRQVDYLTALRDIDLAISSTFDIRLSLTALLSRAVSLLTVDAAAVLLVNTGLFTLEYVAGLGFRTRAVEAANVRLGESLAGRAAMERRLIQIPNLAEEPDNPVLSTLFKDEMFVSYYGVPLIVKGKVIGVLEVFHRTVVERDQNWLDFLHTLAGQAALAIDNAQLFDSLQRSNMDLTLAYDATIEGWSRAMDLRDKETEGHTQRVTELTLELVRAMDITEARVTHIRHGALLHDIGKLGVPDSILLKPDQLTNEEWAIMRQHPTHAYEMLSPIAYLKHALDIPYCHHEKWDGSGYPRGLKNDQIPLIARIFSVADVWDALRSDRPYRARWSRERALAYIRAQAGKHFDPKVVEAFLNLPPHE